ncbi:MAG: RdgB/HAM1 family non-canonical purine NTP pyrophosphatase [Clostridia bacterium]|nr:RdgB/HAM1 family non-canonical purine NTP pyrophosphatase [Clostridia bacterium]
MWATDMKKYTVVLASRNAHKVSELQKLLNGALGDVIELKSLDEVGITEEIVEDGSTFEENAMIKARAAAKSGFIGLGDDSGLVVPALDMAPGIYSARYAGEHGDDAANNALLLKNLEGERDRRAAFVCSLCCAFPDESAPIRATGVVEGEILINPRGKNGFGYDPLFWVDELGKTMAELSADEKNAISHRGAAVRQFARKFARRVGLIEDND